MSSGPSTNPAGPNPPISGSVSRPAPAPAEVVNATGAPVAGMVPTWQAGTAEFPDGFPAWAAGGGGSQPTTRAQFLSTNQSLTSGAFTLMPWVKASGDDLLDLTDPTTPLVITAGVYAVNVGALSSASPSGAGPVYIELDMDASAEDAIASTQIPVAASGTPAQPSVTLVYYVPAGGQITCGITQTTGGALTFKLQATVQRLS